MSPTERKSSYCHTALSDISNRMVGVEITTQYALFSFWCGVFQIVLFGLQDRSVSVEDDATWW